MKKSGNKYSASITGDMTLSVLDENGFKIIGVDMLSKGTLRAGTNGDLLTKALNDLELLAKCLSDDLSDNQNNYIKGKDISNRPWRFESSWERKTISLYDGCNKQFASRRFTKNISKELFYNIIEKINHAVDKVNRMDTKNG